MKNKLQFIVAIIVVCALASWVQISESRHHHLFVHLPVTHAASCLTASFSAGGVTWNCNAAFLGNGNSGSGGQTPQSITYSPAPGTALIIWFYTCADAGACTTNTTGTTYSIKDNINNPETCFQQSPGSPFSLADSAGFKEVGILAVCPSAPSGITSVTVTNTANSSAFMAFWLTDFTVSTGLPSSSTIDKDNSAVSSTTTTSASVTLSANTVNPNDLIIGLIDDDNDEAQTGFGTGFGKIVCDTNTNGCLQAKAVSSTGSYTACAAWSTSPTNCVGSGGTVDSWYAAAMGVKANAPSGAPPNQFPRSY
jgi:hypothetical protein